MKTYTLQTPSEGFCPITREVRAAVAESGLAEGAVLVYCPHTTAGVAINENADPDVARDLLYALDRTFPDRPEFRHQEGNSAAHLKAICVGSSVAIPVSDGKLLLGRWQGVYFCEFDGPRTRTFVVSTLQGA